MPDSGRSPTSVRRELLISTAVLFAGASLVAVAAAAVTFPFIESAAEVAIFIALFIAADLAILFVFLRAHLRRSVFDPLERIGSHAESIAGGNYERPIPTEEGEELDRLVRSLNTMAERLISDQRKLVENVRSLDRTNRDLVEATEGLVRAARMVSVGTLAAGLAHEVGNPLGALIGYLDVARRRAAAGGDIEIPLTAAVEEARRIDRIVRSVMEFARPDGSHEDGAGTGAHRPAVSVVQAVDRALTLMEGRGALEGVEVHRSIGEGSHLVNGLQQHLEQILLNLLTNAVLALSGRPAPQITVRVSTEPAEIERIRARRADDPPELDYTHRRRIPLLLSDRKAIPGEDRERDVVLEVLDNGPGIPPDRISRLFDPFYTTRAPGEGAGLGLAITARIVQELGGVIRAENRKEGGARFVVRLPEADDDAEEGDAP
jgi:hypothetical protein